MNTPCPVPASTRTARSNSTGARRLSYQYPGSGLRTRQPFPGHRRDHRDPGRAGDDAGQRGQDLLPDRLHLPAVRGVVHRQTHLVRTSSAWHAATSSSSAASSPDTTVASGLFTAATASRSPHAAIRSRTGRRARPATPSPHPPPGPLTPGPATPCSAAPPPWPRPPATRSPPRPPPRSPPANGPPPHPGATPAASQAAASDTITAHSTGCTTSTRSRPGAPSAPASTCSRSQSTYGASARRALGQPRREHRAGRGQLPAHPGPLAALPGEHEHHPAPPPGREPPVTTPAAGCPAATAASPAASSSRSAPVITARCSNTVRVVASDHPHRHRIQARAGRRPFGQPARLRPQARRRSGPTPARPAPRGTSSGSVGSARPRHGLRREPLPGSRGRWCR